MQRIAIIGSGPTAIYTAKYLISNHKPVSITIFEAQEQAGKGTPYHQDWNDAEMLANIASIEIPPITETLMHWLTNLQDEELAKIGICREEVSERTFFPRVALGEYFHAQLAKLVHEASAQGSIITINTLHKVLDVAVEEDGIKLSVKTPDLDVKEFTFNYAVMATGHAWPTETEVKPGYFLSPWPASALKTIPNCHVGILGTSLSAIDALVALSVARGMFARTADGDLYYQPEPGTENFRATIMSRKGLLPEADFYHPIPYKSLSICTSDALERLKSETIPENYLDEVFALFKSELLACAPEYCKRIGLESLQLEAFCEAYFAERLCEDPFIWAEKNLAEAKENEKNKHTVPWRYAILRMHEVIGDIVPYLLAEDHKRFQKYLKPIFVDDYATVPHESIERLLALHKAGKLDILRLGDEYDLDNETTPQGATLEVGNNTIHFPAFIEALGQRALSVYDFPFPTLWKQGLIQKATVPYESYLPTRKSRFATIGGIALDDKYRPISKFGESHKLYCLSLPFMLGQFPFAQGITSSHDMGEKVAQDIHNQLNWLEFENQNASFPNILEQLPAGI